MYLNTIIINRYTIWFCVVNLKHMIGTLWFILLMHYAWIHIWYVHVLHNIILLQLWSHIKWLSKPPHLVYALAWPQRITKNQQSQLSNTICMSANNMHDNTFVVQHLYYIYPATYNMAFRSEAIWNLKYIQNFMLL